MRKIRAVIAAPILFRDMLSICKFFLLFSVIILFIISYDCTD